MVARSRPPTATSGTRFGSSKLSQPGSTQKRDSIERGSSDAGWRTSPLTITSTGERARSTTIFTVSALEANKSSSGSGLNAAVGMVSGAVTAVTGVISVFQNRAMNKSLDIIVKHTLEGRMEKFRHPRGPLDVLANQLAAMAIEQENAYLPLTVDVLRIAVGLSAALILLMAVTTSISGTHATSKGSAVATVKR